LLSSSSVSRSSGFFPLLCFTSVHFSLSYYFYHIYPLFLGICLCFGANSVILCVVKWSRVAYAAIMRL
jgi:hypothetical protein